MRKVPKHKIYQIVPKSLGTIFSLKAKNYYYVSTSANYSQALSIVKSSNLVKLTNNYYQSDDTAVVLGRPCIIINSDKPHPLVEDTRVQVIKKTKAPTPYNRYKNRLPIKSYESTFKLFDVNEFRKTGSLVIDIAIGKYSCIIQINNFLSRLKRLDKVTYRAVRMELTRALDREDILVDCSCPDFKYRYAYTATIGGFKYGRKEKRPSDKTNPNLEGSVCKHLAFVLSNKLWVSKYSSAINSYLKKNPELLEDRGNPHGTI